MVAQGPIAAIYVVKNGVEKWFYDKDDNGNERQVTVYISLHLNKGDQVWLKNVYANTLHSSDVNELSFLGYQM